MENRIKELLERQKNRELTEEERQKTISELQSLFEEIRYQGTD